MAVRQSEPSNLGSAAALSRSLTAVAIIGIFYARNPFRFALRRGVPAAGGGAGGAVPSGGGPDIFRGAMILAGIDEAGDGALLGPLVVGCCAFDVAGVDGAAAAVLEIAPARAGGGASQ